MPRESTPTIAAIAHETGFSDACGFRHSCIRWTGQTPTTTRRARAIPPRALR
ncbi:AraC family transcriptional regulator [Lentzea xinjiangensis]|uniref:AraC family transcriptional regulator n=1 Tax=Lentzea xinjiangensis TaxID=402600 RepID=UPI0011607988